MDIELVAKKMRDRAIRIELEETGQRARRKQLPKAQYKSVEDRIEELKKLYFNAGRWAGGARDHTARMAAEQVESLDAIA